MITLKAVSLQLGGKPLLEDSSLSIYAGQKIGICGRNGCGKSTLFKLLRNEVHADQGEFLIPKDLRIAHMAQETPSSDRPAIDYVLDGHHSLRQIEGKLARCTDDIELAKLYGELDGIDAYRLKSQAEQLMIGLGFDPSELNNAVSDFSGGWRIRLNLAQALMSDADLMLLDEPTNHLDLDASLWLENWLERYEGTLLLISHDRDFLDNLVDSIAHIENHTINLYKGGYSDFERQKAERLSQQQAAYEKQQQRRQEIETFVNRFRAKATKAKQAQSRLKELERLETIAPAHIDSPFTFEIPRAEKISTPLISLQHCDIGYPDSVIIRQANLSLLPGSRIGLLGHNGAGKSTLIKTLVGSLQPMQGERMGGEHLKIGYFAQHQVESLDLDASPFIILQRLAPKATEQSVRNYLGGFAFNNDKALEPCGTFSGGEKARLALAAICWQKPNLLLLDEPSNHLDIEMRHALVMALQSFEGAIILVSHDRHLLNNTVDEYWLVANGKVAEFKGTLEDYQHLILNKAKPISSNESAPSDGKIDKKQLRQQAAETRKKLSPIKRRIDQAEKKLEQLQQQLGQFEDQLADNDLYQEANKAKLQDILQQQGLIKSQQNELEEQWLTDQDVYEELLSELKQDE